MKLKNTIGPYFGIILLLAILIVLAQALTITFSGVPRGEDYSVHFARAVFLGRSGFHGNVKEWYDGHTLFLHYPPAYFYFLQPFLMVESGFGAIALSIIAIFFIGGVFCWHYSKNKKIEKKYALLLFLVWVANPIMVFNLFWGRLPEIFGWLVFLAGALTFDYYEEKKLDMKFFALLAIISFTLILSYIACALLFSILALGFMLKRRQELRKILSAFFIGIIASSFWWVPFILDYGNFSKNILLYVTPIKIFPMAIFDSSYQTPFLLVRFLLYAVPALVFLSLFLHEKKKTLFLPTAVLAVACIIQLTSFVPFFSSINPPGFGAFFILLSALIILRNRESISNKKIGKITIALFFIILFALSVMNFRAFNFTPDPVVNGYNDIIRNVEARYVVADAISRRVAVYSFAAAQYELETPFGGSPQEISREEQEVEFLISKYVKDGNCDGVRTIAKEKNFSEIASGLQESKQLEENCGFELKACNDYVCIAKITAETT